MLKRQAEIEIDTIIAIRSRIEDDLRDLEKWWPLAKRGTNANRALRSLIARVDAMGDCANDAKAALQKPPESA